MEKIKIKSMVSKGTVFIVGYTMPGYPAMPVNEGTMNEGWQSAEIKYLEGLGVGAIVDVEMGEGANKRDPSKPYWNIKKVNMSSGVKGELSVPSTDNTTEEKPEIKAEEKPEQRAQFMSVKDVTITAQCLTKCWSYGKPNVTVDEVWDAYHAYVLRFEEEG